MMNFDQFAQAVAEKVKDYLPDAYQDAVVSLNTVLKNNAIEKHALTVVIPGINITPNIYLDEFYTAYSSGRMLFQDVVKEVARIRVEFGVEKSIDTSKMFDWERVMGNVEPRLVNAADNDLSERPHRYMEDLAVVYCLKVENSILKIQDDDTICTIAITNAIMKQLGVTEEELYNRAILNIESDIDILPMGDLLTSMSGVECSMESDAMYIVTNKDKRFGASAILASLQKIYEKLGKFFIIPSSVHEVIIFPAKLGQPDFLKEMISEVNTECVSPEEVLSNNLYCYDGCFALA